MKLGQNPFAPHLYSEINDSDPIDPPHLYSEINDSDPIDLQTNAAQPDSGKTLLGEHSEPTLVHSD